MRPLRILKQGVWYHIRTRINNREPLFRYSAALALFAKVLGETGQRFKFEIRSLCLEDDWLSFYIKPADALKLPAIMKWIKQVFAQRYNRQTGRIGHIWGDRYWSCIVEDAEAEGSGPAGVSPRLGKRLMGVRPQGGETTLPRLFFLKFPLLVAPTPG
jgi:putative transposase